MLGRLDQCAYERARIVDRDLHRLLNVGVPRSLVGRVDADDIREEERVELSLFEHLKQRHPGIEIVELSLPRVGHRQVPWKICETAFIEKPLKIRRLVIAISLLDD